MANTGTIGIGNGNDELRSRVEELDQSLEQALVAAEDAREEARLIAEDRARMEEELASQRRAMADLQARLVKAEADRLDALKLMDDAAAGLSVTAQEGVHESERLRVSYEELQVIAEELERVNTDLERRVEERTAELTAANAELRRRDEQFRLAQKCADAGAWDWDVSVNRVTWSLECYDLLGLNPRLDRPSVARWIARLLPQDRAILRKAMDESVASDHDDFRAEFRIRHPVRGVRWIATMGRVTWRDHGGRPTRITGLAIDVTDRKTAEEEMRRAREEAVAADRAKTRFLAAASHDLRQPIQAAALYAHVLRSAVGSDANAAEALKLLKTSIESLGGMLDGLLDLSRLDAGAVEVAVADIPVNDILQRLCAEFQGVAAAAGGRMRCIPCSVMVSSDRHLLERALRNLVANAVAHGLTKPDARILLGCRRRGNVVEFLVCDNGPGIPDEARDLIFEEFRQLHNQERNAQRGFGLGLSIVSRIMRLLGLRVEVRSVLGRGAVFSIAVPCSRTVAPPRRAVAVAAGDDELLLKGRTVFLVEDDEAVRRGLTMMLKGWGVRVVAFASTEELEARLRRLRTPPHVVVTDYRLPGGRTGRTVVELVRRRWDVPGVIITGDTAPEHLREAKSLGCRLLHKPVEPDVLARVLGEAMVPAV